MATTYEIWDLRARSIIDFHPSEAAALAAIARAVRTHGAERVGPLALIREDSRGRSKLAAEGTALVERALAAAPASSPADTVASV